MRQADNGTRFYTTKKICSLFILFKLKTAVLSRCLRTGKRKHLVHLPPTRDTHVYMRVARYKLSISTDKGETGRAAFIFSLSYLQNKPRLTLKMELQAKIRQQHWLYASVPIHL